MYPFYEKSGEGRHPHAMHPLYLLPPDYEKSSGGVWEYATAWDIGKAAEGLAADEFLA